MTLAYIYHQVERPLPPILAQMTHRGVLLDRAYLQSLVQSWDEAICALKDGVLSGINPNSNPQVEKELLVRGFQLRKRTKGGTHYSVDHGVLTSLLSQRMADPFLRGLLHHNELMTLLTTFGQPLLEWSAQDGRVHCRWWQVGTATGRLSSSDPSLQNIPTRTEEGHKLRQCFIPSPGMMWVKGDYSQIEMRIVAVLAQETGLLQAYKEDPKMDAHSEVARLMGLSPEQRYQGKTLNFALLYGEGDRALAQQLGMSLQGAQELRQRYWDRLPHIESWLQLTRLAAQAYGYVETLFGRRRTVDIHPRMESWLREKLLREACNMPVQGTAADILKLFLGRVGQEIHQEKGGKFGEHLLLTVHDELDWEVPQEQAQDLVAWAKGVGEHIVDIGVPLIVDIKVGRGWT